MEQLTLNQRVQGSSPCAPTTFSQRFYWVRGANYARPPLAVVRIGNALSNVYSPFACVVAVIR